MIMFMTDATHEPPADNAAPQPSTADSAEARPAPEGASVRKKIGIGTVTAAVVAVFLFVRVLAVSKWDWGVASDIADSFDFDDAVSILFGTLFELPIATGIIISVVLPLSIFRLFWLSRHRDRSGTVTDIFVVITLAVTLFVLIRSYALWWPLVIVIIVTAALITAALLPEDARVRKVLSRLGRNTGALLIVSLMVLAVTVSAPWMPREEITYQDKVLHGYVLEENAGFVKVLTDSHEVLYLKVADIEERAPAD